MIEKKINDRCPRCVEVGKRSSLGDKAVCKECWEQLGLPTSAKPQPSPSGRGPEILPKVIHDLLARAEMGEQKYGTKLRAHNGRDALIDAYQEALDLVMYLRQAISERET
jgi:hypothetical protein